MNDPIECSAYCVECLRDKKHGETFAISSIHMGSLRQILGYLTEAKLRSELLNRGASVGQIENYIRRARAQADLKQHGK
jgi:hypothetical protein